MYKPDVFFFRSLRINTSFICSHPGLHMKSVLIISLKVLDILHIQCTNHPGLPVPEASQGDANFTTTQVEISPFLSPNILIGIHELPQISMLCNSPIFNGVQGFKKTIPKHRFITVSKYLHLSDLNIKELSDLL